MRVKVYQIQTERDKNNVKFRNYEETERQGGVNSSAYQCVFAGDIRARKPVMERAVVKANYVFKDSAYLVAVYADDIYCALVEFK